MILIQGNALMNECSLTGESVPINKELLIIKNGLFDVLTKNMLYSGT